MRRKYLAAAYIAAFEWLLSWQQWDGVIKTILAVWMFWGINLTLLIMVEMEEKSDAAYKGNQKRKASGMEKENAELRKAVEEALQDLQDSECPLGVRALSASIRLERALKKDSEELQLNRIQKK